MKWICTVLFLYLAGGGCIAQAVGSMGDFYYLDSALKHPNEVKALILFEETVDIDWSIFPNLEHINFLYCKIDCFGKGVGTLKKLRVVDIVSSDLKRLTPEIKGATQLKKLKLPGNPHLRLPNLSKLDSLRGIDLRGNKYMKLPHRRKFPGGMKYLWILGIPASKIPPSLHDIEDLQYY